MAWQVGGDGLVHELVSGMLQRPDHLRLPVGVLPAGSLRQMRVCSASVQQFINPDVACMLCQMLVNRNKLS